MKKTALFLTGVFAFLVFLFAACVSPKKVGADKQQLEELDKKLSQNSIDLKKLDSLRQEKDNQNEIDSAANSRIKNFINRTGIEIDTIIGENSLIINGFVVNKSDWDQLRKILSRTRGAQARINQKISFLEDLLNRNMVVKLDQDVLFQPGSYHVAPAVVKDMTRIFDPAAREIDRFTQKYPDFPLSLVITFKGYADATVIDEGSGLYNNLKSRLRMSGKEPDSKELNKELSRARAEAVRNLFKEFAASRSDNGIYIKNVLYLYEGKGESLPDPKITDYKVNDPRRRVVLLFWSIFPD